MRMNRLISLLLLLLISYSLQVSADAHDVQSVEDNVFDNADIEQQQINSDLIPTPASPGESVEGRTEFTTPQQNKEIYNEYEKLQQEQGSGQ